mgnify:FL=1
MDWFSMARLQFVTNNILNDIKISKNSVLKNFLTRYDQAKIENEQYSMR